MGVKETASGQPAIRAGPRCILVMFYVAALCMRDGNRKRWRMEKVWCGVVCACCVCEGCVF